MSESDDLIMGGGGRKLPALQLSEIGEKVSGVITRISDRIQMKEQSGPRKGQPKFWPNSNDPVMQVAIEIKTDLRDPLVDEDDGSRTWWVRQSSDAQRALRDAVKAAGRSGTEVGATVTVELIGKDTSFSIPKHLHRVVYTPPGAQAANDLVMGSPVRQEAPPVAANVSTVDINNLPPEALALIAQIQSGSVKPAATDGPPF
ncbi:hypothetical protein [Amycolatopsis kentuckyensis]|uniref:hypothetical protein n=1 Tax=Amycolatopsis kentuckyensis TaxID=218823 RepID=UPI000A3D3541|nr:hypothetical protein [Amycolatopsis kentuckyensis]